MPKGLSNLRALNRTPPLELVLEINSFAGGENTVGEDQALKINEARVIKNWDADSLGGMIRSKGFNLVGSGSGYASSAGVDLLVQHVEGVTTELYGVIKGDLVKKVSSVMQQDDDGAFTSNILCHAVSKGEKLWITNSTDNLKYKTQAGDITTPADQPSSARERVYYHKGRLFVEGGGKTVYSSRAGTGNWTAADAWSLANDASNIDLPDRTTGAVPGFPSGSEITVFTKFKAYGVSNFPDVTFRDIPNSRGCHNGYTVARADVGVFLFSMYPTKAILLWNGVDWVDLTSSQEWLDTVNLTARMFGIARNDNYYFFFNESGSGVTTPNRTRIYDTKFGRWMERPINPALSEAFGYPALLTYDSNELYVASSIKPNVYELETTDDSDEEQNTNAVYKTKDFTSKDFSAAGGGGNFPLDETRMKLLKMIITYYGSTGALTVKWSADRGRITGQQTVNLSEGIEGDLINTTFTVNSSKIISSGDIPDRTKFFSFNNKAVGRSFNFEISNRATGDRPIVKRIKFIATTIDET